jgi:hypothetical protein
MAGIFKNAFDQFNLHFGRSLDMDRDSPGALFLQPGQIAVHPSPVFPGYHFAGSFAFTMEPDNNIQTES